jgi:hypothetical protein
MNTQKMSARASRILCQTKTITFEKIYIKESVHKCQDLFKSNNYTFVSKITKSKYSKSKLFDYITQKEIDTLTTKTINKYISDPKNNQSKLTIQLDIVENDIKDPRKKTKKSKLYAGYLVYEFKLDNKVVYKIQTDFMDFQGKDIANRIECVFNSFLTIKK